MKIVTEPQIFAMLSTEKNCVFVHPQHKAKRSQQYADQLGIPLEDYESAEYLVYDFETAEEAFAFSMQFNNNHFYIQAFIDGKVINEVNEFKVNIDVSLAI